MSREGIRKKVLPHLPGEGRECFHLLLIDSLSKDPIPSLHGFRVQGYLESETICRNTQAEELHEPPFPIRCYPGCLLERGSSFFRQSTVAAPKLTC